MVKPISIIIAATPECELKKNDSLRVDLISAKLTEGS